MFFIVKNHWEPSFTDNPRISQEYVELIVWPTRTSSLWTIPLMSKKNDEHALDFALHLSRHFWSRWICDLSCSAHAFFPERLSNHCQGLRHTFSEICKTFVAVPLSDPSHIHTAAWNFVRLLPRYASTIISIASYCYNCSKDGNTSLGNYGNAIVCTLVTRFCLFLQFLKSDWVFQRDHSLRSLFQHDYKYCVTW
jgi:hypothetical protein